MEGVTLYEVSRTNWSGDLKYKPWDLIVQVDVERVLWTSDGQRVFVEGYSGSCYECGGGNPLTYDGPDVFKTHAEADRAMRLRNRVMIDAGFHRKYKKNLSLWARAPI